MPAGYAHLDFGKQVLNSLEVDIQERIKNKIDLYNIGVHGPDILFYHRPLSENVVNRMGNNMHRFLAYDFFKNGKRVIEQSDDKEASLVYMLGFITHFVLDGACHGYVGEVEKSKGLTHSEIESEFDRELLVMNGLDPLTTSLTTHVHRTPEVDKIIAPFFGLYPREIKNSLKGMKRYLGFLLAPGKMKRNCVLGAMKFAEIYDKYKGLMINYEPNPICKDDVQELIIRKDKAIEYAHLLIHEYLEFMDGSTLDERFRRDYG